jgi:hypothetical protein
MSLLENKYNKWSLIVVFGIIALILVAGIAMSFTSLILQKVVPATGDTACSNGTSLTANSTAGNITCETIRGMRVMSDNMTSLNGLSSVVFIGAVVLMLVVGIRWAMKQGGGGGE